MNFPIGLVMPVPSGAPPHKIFRVRPSADNVLWQVDVERGSELRANSVLVLANACLRHANETGYASFEIQLQTDPHAEHITVLHTVGLEQRQ